MSQNPLFSIIIPIYNTEKELPRCVDSVLAQTFENFELVLVDDGSKDGSGAICDAYAARDARVKVFHKENGGSSSARNLGIEKATGDYLLFLDSDDYWDLPEALAGIQDLIAGKNGSVDVICFGTEICDYEGKLIKVRKAEVDLPDFSGKEDILQQLIYTNQYFSASYVKAVSRQFALERDLTFNQNYTSGEDIDWSARVMVLSKCIAVYPRTFYKRIRGRSGAVTSSIGMKNVLDVIDTIENGVAFAEEHAESWQLKDLYLEYWAYQYAMLLGLASQFCGSDDYPALFERMSKLKWLLKYKHVKKVKAVYVCRMLLGLPLTIRLMGWYYARKG